MGKTVKDQPHRKLYEDIKVFLHEARNAVDRNINTAMVMTYFEIGRMIVEYEQAGARRAGYAKETLMSLSQKLNKEFGRGFSVDNLELMRRFYFVYSKSETLSRKSSIILQRLLRCFVLIDFKIGKLKHQDIGQMQMYVNYYDRMIKSSDENSTVGIILCKEAKKMVVDFTLPNENKQIFARKYQLYLPSKEELRRQLEELIRSLT